MTPTEPTVDAAGIVDTAATSTGAAGAAAGGAAKAGPSQATRLVLLADQGYRVLLGEDGAPYAVRLDGPNLALPMRGRDGLRQLLARGYYLKFKAAPSASALTDALAVLAGKATEHDREPVALRLARHHDAIVIDLGAADGRCVVVYAGRWEVRARSPVLFRRTQLTGEMAVPIGGGDITTLADNINAGEAEIRLLVGWLVAGLIPDLPHPILAVLGEQGTAKTSLMKQLAMLVDPSPAPTRTAPRDIKQWAVTASASWFIGLDNVSGMTDWQSDAYCRAVTGDALTDRALYTDADVSVIAFRRLLAFTSVDPGSLRGDLGDRMLPVELHRIATADRKTDAEVTAAFAAAAPHLSGALLDLLAKVLDRLPQIRPTDLPRMADFARILAAVDAVTGWTTVQDYAGTAADIAETVIDSDPFAVAIRDFAVSKSEWTGTAAELRAEVTPEKPPKDWPKSPRAVSGAVRRITPALRSVGVTVEHSRDGRNRTRTITLAAEPDSNLETPSRPSAPSAQRADQREHADGSDAPTVPTNSSLDDADGRPTQPSAADTTTDLRKPERADGADGRDGVSHSLSGPPRWKVSAAPIDQDAS